MIQQWWKSSVVYQVYWRSFMDQNGDGIGDLQGVIAKLDYLKELGIDIVWLNPCYESPDVDNGYDISDYEAISAKAGTMADFDQLLAAVHDKGMKLIMDLVVNHTSDQHPWFLASRSSRSSEKRDWYIWKDGKGHAPPNNYRSYFVPSAWTLDTQTGQYFFHSFTAAQPDLNWKNPEVRAAIYQMMRFWLDKGIDGFRMDVVNLLAKPEGFPDAAHPEHVSYLANNPGIHGYLQEMQREVLSHYDIMTVGEIPFVTPQQGLAYVDEKHNELQMLFHFQVLDEMPTWDLDKFRSIQRDWYDVVWSSGWYAQFLNNHDHTRQVSRFGNDQEYREVSAKLLATMVHTLPGTPYIYQGEELGMTGVRYSDIQQYEDVAMRAKYAEEVAAGGDPVEVLARLAPLARDNSRTPMQWSGQAQAGFTTGTPWLPVNPNYVEIHALQERADPNSVFGYYRQLIALRKTHPVMVYGQYQDVSEQHPKLYLYTRQLGHVTWLVVLNPNAQETVCDVSLPATYAEPKRLILANYEVSGTMQSLIGARLRPYEARIYEL